jgi:hypothetical protein
MAVIEDASGIFVPFTHTRAFGSRALGAGNCDK